MGIFFPLSAVQRGLLVPPLTPAQRHSHLFSAVLFTTPGGVKSDPTLHRFAAGLLRVTDLSAEPHAPSMGTAKLFTVTVIVRIGVFPRGPKHCRLYVFVVAKGPTLSNLSGIPNAFEPLQSPVAEQLVMLPIARQRSVVDCPVRSDVWSAKKERNDGIVAGLMETLNPPRFIPHPKPASLSRGEAEVFPPYAKHVLQSAMPVAKVPE
jgi:hypothetical protein